MKVCTIYFSPTGGTKKVALSLARALSPSLDSICEIDLSLVDYAFDKVEITSDYLCVVAMPCFGGRIPQVALDRLNRIKWSKVSVLLAVTYGNRHYDDSLSELNDWAEEKGLFVVGALLAVTEHSMINKYGKGRPNAKDINELEDYAKCLRNNLSSRNFLDIKRKKPYRDYKGSSAKPITNSNCIRCGICQESCPVFAIPKTDPSKTDYDLCISCMRCIKICPHKARLIEPLALKRLDEFLKPRCIEEKENIFF